MIDFYEQLLLLRIQLEEERAALPHLHVLVEEQDDRTLRETVDLTNGREPIKQKSSCSVILHTSSLCLKS